MFAPATSAADVFERQRLSLALLWRRGFGGVLLGLPWRRDAPLEVVDLAAHVAESLGPLGAIELVDCALGFFDAFPVNLCFGELQKPVGFKSAQLGDSLPMYDRFIPATFFLT